MKNYGKAIKTLRKTANMTQAQLAEKLNVTPQTVSKWENGVNMPDIDGVENMCAVFAVSMDEFMRLADDSAPTPSQSIPTPQPHVATPPNQATAAAQTLSASTAVKSKRLKPIYITVISVMAAIIAFAAVLVPILVSRKNTPKALSANEIYQKVNPSVFYIEVETQNDTVGGSGFFINSTGTAVTNFHVVDGLKSAKVTLSNGQTYVVDKILGVDNVRDVALIHVAVPSSKSVTFANSDGVKTGDKVYAIGFPQSFILGIQDSTLTEGLVSKSSYSIDGVNYIQSTVNITHGNSGGVLVDVYGRVVGMTTAGIDVGNIDYMNLSVPSNTVKGVKSNVNLSVTDYYVQAGVRYEVKYYVDDSLYAIRNVSPLFEKIPPLKPTLNGAEFLGWYADSSFQTPFDFTQSPTSDVSLYGKIKYTGIVFKFSGGSGSTGKMQDISANVGEELIFPDNEFERTGYLFSGWSFDGKIYYADDTIPVPDSSPVQTVTANWTPIVYNVIYKYENTTTEPESYAYDKSFVLKNSIFTRTGYKQTGWVHNDKTYGLGADVKKLTAKNGDTIELIPKWEAIKFTIKVLFNDPEIMFNGVKYGTNTGTTYKYYDCIYGVDPFNGTTPTRVPFAFDGWHIYLNDGTVINCDIEYAGTIEGCTIYAEPTWVSGDYTLQLGRDFFEVELSGKQRYTLPLVAELGLAQFNPGKRFVGWKNFDSNPQITYADGETVSDLMFDGYYKGTKVFVRLFDMWEYVNYTIKFDGNGGNGTMQDVSCVYDTALTLPQNNFVKIGYSFVGWEYGDDVYADKSKVKNLTTTDGEQIIFKAKWVSDYDGNGTKDNPYKINNCDELADLHFYVDNVDGGNSAHYVLTADVDCVGKKLYPIGVKRKFTGVFDGGGHVIKNPVFARSDGDYEIFGLFGFVLDGQIKNVGIEQYDYVRGSAGDDIHDENIRGFGAGAIAYRYESTHKLEKCYAITTQTMNFLNKGMGYFGGLVGSLVGEMENCYAAYNATLNVNDASGGNVSLGGLAGIVSGGYMHDENGEIASPTVKINGRITHCYSDVNINITNTAKINPSAYIYLGLIASNAYNASIDYCFTTGNIIYEFKKADASITLYDERGVGLISGVGTDGSIATALYTAGKITFTDSDAQGGVYENQQTTLYTDLCLTEWLSQNLGFDTAVWKATDTELPTLVM
ncbi:MAG: trypsin-like peptidase domain-containing protein [Clostridiales bacterium]|nr:trypsin-like peptidase domain-containing protein [Clostridiales bacterium]